MREGHSAGNGYFWAGDMQVYAAVCACGMQDKVEIVGNAEVEIRAIGHEKLLPNSVHFFRGPDAAFNFCANILENAGPFVVICPFNKPLLENTRVEAQITYLFTDNPRLLFIKLLNVFWHHRLEDGGPLFEFGCETIITSNPKVHSSVAFYDNVTIGKNVEIHAGTVIGAPGHGYERDEDGTLIHFPHLGGVIIEDDVVVGANCCIDRGSLGNTIIKKGTKLDNLVFISHNCIIGRNVSVAGPAVFGGGTVVGDNVTVATGAVGRNKITIGDGAMIGIGAVVTKDVPAYATVMGNPAEEADKYKANRARLKQTLSHSFHYHVKNRPEPWTPEDLT